MSNLSDKVVLVTGGSSGIGFETAKLFAEKGARVVITSRDVAKGTQAFNELKLVHKHCLFIKADVSKAIEVEALFNQILSSFGGLDIAINNAGISGMGNAPLNDYPESSWDELIEINLKGVWLCIKNELKEMIKNRNGAIVNVSSVAGLKSGKVSAAYTASKHGVIGLTKQAAIENAHHNIRVNAVCPGFIHTPMLVKDLGIEKLAVTSVPLGRCGQPREVANTIVWLCSDEASFITGAILPVDGGMCAQ